MYNKHMCILMTAWYRANDKVNCAKYGSDEREHWTIVCRKLESKMAHIADKFVRSEL